MHLDVGEVDFTSHVHVPAVSVQSYAPSDDLSNFTGHAAAVSSQRSSAVGRHDCTRGCGNEMCHVSVVPLTWCGLPLGLVGSQLLDESHIRRPTAGSGSQSRTESHEDR